MTDLLFLILMFGLLGGLLFVLVYVLEEQPLLGVLMILVLLALCACTSPYVRRLDALVQEQQRAEERCLAARARADPDRRLICTRSALCSQALTAAGYSVDHARQLAARTRAAALGSEIAPPQAVRDQAEREAAQAEAHAQKMCLAAPAAAAPAPAPAPAPEVPRGP